MENSTDASSPESLPPDSSNLITKVLTLSEVTEFLNEKTVVHHCLACSKNDWNIVIDPSVEFGYIGIQRNGGFGLPPPVVPMILVVCNICGYTKTFAKFAILDWIDRGKK